MHRVPFPTLHGASSYLTVETQAWWHLLWEATLHFLRKNSLDCNMSACVCCPRRLPSARPENTSRNAAGPELAEGTNEHILLYKGLRSQPRGRCSELRPCKAAPPRPAAGQEAILNMPTMQLCREDHSDPAIQQDSPRNSNGPATEPRPCAFSTRKGKVSLEKQQNR